MTKKTAIKEEENSVENRLRAIAHLQKALTSIDKIRTLRGELPLEVQDIEDDIAGTQTRLDYYAAAAKALTQSIAAERNKISGSKELLEKYRKQLDHVRNNREYDNLSKEIEYQELEAQLSEKRIKEYTVELQGRKNDIARLKEKIELRTGDLQAKKGELDRIIKETKDEEERLLKEAKYLEDQIQDERILGAVYRIRNGSHNGLAVVPIDRDACGGCFNRIPPQRQLEIKLAQKIIVCEYCGRIIVDPEFVLDKEEDIVESQKAVAEEEKEAKSTAKKATAKKTATKRSSTTAKTAKEKAPTKKTTATKKSSTAKAKPSEAKEEE